jgi:hypothetical protein
MRMSSVWTLTFRFSRQNSICIYILSHACHMSSNFIRLDLTKAKVLDEEWKSRFSSLRNFVQPPLNSTLLCPNFLSTPSSQTLCDNILPLMREAMFSLKRKQVIVPYSGPGWCSRYSDSLRAGLSGDRIQVRLRFSAPVQNGPGAHPAYTMGKGSLSRG